MKAVRSISIVAMSEIFRDRILYGVLFFAFLLMGVAVLASRLTFIRPDRVILDFGLSLIQISGVVIAVLFGASMVQKEVDRRTIHLILSRPVSRYGFVAGKLLGLLSVIGAHIVLMTGVYVGVLIYFGGEVSWTLFLALIFVFIQTGMISALAILFSTFMTRSMAICCASGMYLIGSNVSQIRFLATRLDDQLGSGVLDVLSWMVPCFEYFQLGTKVTYSLPIAPLYVVGVTFYGLGWIALSTLVSGLALQRREF